MLTKKIIAALLITFASAGMAAALEGDEAPLSELLADARANSPQIAAARERTAAEKLKINQAQAKMGPDLSVGMGALWQRDGISTNIPVPAFGSLSVPIIGSHAYAAAVGLTQLIYSGGSLGAQKQAAQLAGEAAAAQERRVAQGVDNAVRRAFYALRSAQAKELVAKEALSLSKNHMEQAEKLFKAGVVAKNDLLRSKVAVASAELDLIRAQNGSALALTALRRAVGAELPAGLEENRRLEQILSSELPPKREGGDIESSVESAVSRREELKVYSLLSEQAEKLARAAHGQTLPQVLGMVGYMAADDKFFPSEQSEPVAAIGVYWNLYDGGEMRAKTNEAKAKARELLYQLDDMKNAVRMEVTQAELNLRSAESRLAVASRQLSEAREDYRIARRRYAEGVGTNLDTLDARLALTNSMTELAAAIYDIKTAEADLAYAMGD
ncbi:MAG: TolC family protein [Synergistaceae bacterium]|nr:TolC family protein [Synergistaceae bacterium]